MMAGIAVIAVIGLCLEKFVFQKIEDYTIVRWGMMVA
jgi:NitT/TauT family transport system permease protein